MHDVLELLLLESKMTEPLKRSLTSQLGRTLPQWFRDAQVAAVEIIIEPEPAGCGGTSD